MTDDDRKLMRERAMAATPGNWFTERPPNDADGWPTGTAVASVGRGAMIYTDHRGGVHPAADREHIAATGPLVTLALLDELDRADVKIAKLTADCAKWQALGREASKTLDECGVTLDRIATIASEAFGPFPVQGVESNLTAIEQGIAKLRIENATVLEQANAASRTVAADWAEMKALRTRVADLERELAAVREIEAGTALR